MSGRVSLNGKNGKGKRVKRWGLKGSTIKNRERKKQKGNLKESSYEKEHIVKVKVAKRLKNKKKRIKFRE